MAGGEGGCVEERKSLNVTLGSRWKRSTKLGISCNKAEEMKIEIQEEDIWKTRVMGVVSKMNEINIAAHLLANTFIFLSTASFFIFLFLFMVLLSFHFFC